MEPCTWPGEGLGEYVIVTRPVTRPDALREIGAAGYACDVLVIGGGATGLGVAVEAASRGYRTLLIERGDFAQGTSSRSTKLVHGGVRYLEQFNLPLVVDALRERGYMLRNAPHLVHKLSFVVPLYSHAARPYYGLGLKLYEQLSGSLSFGPSTMLSAAETQRLLPTVTRPGLRGGVMYRDGHFDDARYVVTLWKTLLDLGGSAINYMGAVRLLHRGGKIAGAVARDYESGAETEITARAVVNATGVFTDEIIHMDDASRAPVLAVSQGSHFVLPAEFLPGRNALMIPKTTDGRVLFAIPWHGHVVIGTTDEPAAISMEPQPIEAECDLLRHHIKQYFGRSLSAQDVTSMWSGLRPLLRHGSGAKTSKLSRDHAVLVASSGLVTVTGGKWTTYRKMGQDAINRASAVAGLTAAPSRTADLKLHGWTDRVAENTPDTDQVYGADLPALNSLDAAAGTSRGVLDAPIHPRLPYRFRHVAWAVRQEMARTLEDVLARRTRALFLDARAAIEAAPAVAELMATELGRDAAWAANSIEAFRKTATGYIYRG